MNSGDFMSNILKNSLKLFLWLLFAAFAGIMLLISFGAIFVNSEQWVMAMFTQVFGLLIVITMVWQSLYNLGFRESNMVRTGHMKENIYKGFIIGAVAQIPFLLFLILSVIFNIPFGIYRFINGAYFWFITIIAGSGVAANSANNIVTHMQDLGVIRNILLALPLLIVPAVAGGVYILGYKGIDVKEKLFYKKRKENE